MISLPPRIGPLTIVRIEGDKYKSARALVRCDRGHEEWRSYTNLRVSLGNDQTTCKGCPSDVQLDILTMIYSCPKSPVSLAELKRFSKRDIRLSLSALVAKGLVTERRYPSVRGTRAFYSLTEAGVEEIYWTPGVSA